MIVFIYMASGYGKRFGANKLFAQVDGSPMYRHGLACYLKTASVLSDEMGQKARVVVVSQYQEILKEAEEAGAKAVYNPYSDQGITASLRLGTMAAEDGDILVYGVADQPRLRPETVTGLVISYLKSQKGMGCVWSQGRPGNPVVFKASIYRAELLELQGDRGGRQIMKRHPEDVYHHEVAASELVDVDLPADIERIEGTDEKGGERN